MSKSESKPESPSIITVDNVLQHLDKVEEYYRTFIGKEGHNPFYELNRIANYKKRLSNIPEPSQTMLQSGFEFKSGIPPVVNNTTHGFKNHGFPV
jgi:hypothetical protein